MTVYAETETEDAAAGHDSRRAVLLVASVRFLIILLLIPNFISAEDIEDFLKKWKDVDLNSIDFRIVQDSKTIVSSLIPFQKVDSGYATGCFDICKDLRKDTTIKVMYGGIRGGGASYILKIPENT